MIWRRRRKVLWGEKGVLRRRSSDSRKCRLLLHRRCGGPSSSYSSSSEPFSSTFLHNRLLYFCLRRRNKNECFSKGKAQRYMPEAGPVSSIKPIQPNTNLATPNMTISERSFCFHVYHLFTSENFVTDLFQTNDCMAVRFCSVGIVSYTPNE